jgi:hypothetical protein
MFNRFALAVLAASLVAGPVLAQNAPSTAPADKSTSATDTSKPVKHARHAKVAKSDNLAKSDKVAQTDEQNVKAVKPVKHARHMKHGTVSSTTGSASPDQDKASKPAGAN